MKAKVFFLSSFFLIASITVSFAQPKGDPIVIGQTFSLQSDVLGEERPYWIYLPDDYSPQENPVAVMYLLDGDGHFHHTSGIVSFLRSQNSIPNMMIVAIPNTTDRTRDLTPPIEKDTDSKQQMPNAGKADNMLKFMKEELIPHIDQQYNTNTYRTLVGHSFGGIFAVYTFLSDPGLFDSYIAISPSMWWDQQNLVDKATAFFDADPKLDNFFYMTMGNEDGEMLGGAMKLAALFEENASDSFQWDFDVMKKETHGSVPHRSTYDGLEAIFESWYSVDLGKLYTEHGMPGIDKHYANISEKLGFEMIPSEVDLNLLGYQLLGTKNYDKAIEIFEENVKRNPGSHNVYDSLGEAYLESGDEDQAIKNYKKSVSIHPGNANGVNVLKRLNVDYDPIREPLKLSEKKLAQYIGDYELAGIGITMHIKIAEGKLVATAEGIPPVTFVPVYKHGFIAQPINALLIFQEDDAGKIEGFEAQTGPGQYASAKRL